MAVSTATVAWGQYSLAELLPPDGSGDPSHFETGPSGPLENLLGIAAGPDLFLVLRHGLHGAVGLRHDHACRQHDDLKPSCVMST